MSAAAAAGHPTAHLALVGNPNCGKTALFNRLTGSRQKVANYTGVTVERKEGRFTGPSGQHFRILDLPGAYSLQPKSPDEAVTRAVCLGELASEPLPDVLIAVVSATNLRLHLRFALEVRALGRPMVLVLNMMDEARRLGMQIDREALARELGVPVVEAIAVQHDGAQALVELLDRGVPPAPTVATPVDLHAETARLLARTVTFSDTVSLRDERLDAVLLHPVWGPLVLTAVLFLMFQAVFSWAGPLMEGIKAGMEWLTGLVNGVMPAGPLRGLLTDGVIAGAGGVLVFLPQILILFLFILALEESGYLPRAAFLLDRVMVGAGLSGRSFIPLLSSFACAVPGIMATRSIQHPRDRLVTILVAPLMTCSARLPVYALLIGAFIPDTTVGGVFNLQGLVLFTLYVAGIVSAVAVSMVLKRWFSVSGQGDTEQPLLLELPAYRLPNPRDLAIGLLERARIFVRRVGTIILSLTVLLWGLGSFPAPPEGATGAAISYSLAGTIGHALEFVFAPIGFNWQICIALVPGMAAREVVVGALATVYALSDTSDAATQQLAGLIGAQWGLPTALSLLAWFVFAPQCISTLAVIRRETNSARTMWLSAAYLTTLAYGAAFLTFHIAKALT